MSLDRLTRRRALRLGAAAAAGAIFRSSETLAAHAEDDFCFVVVSDIHYRDDRCGEWLHRVTAQIRASRPRPAFVMLAGDLSESATAEQLGAVREIFRTLPMPMRAVIGNHDCTEDGRANVFRAVYGNQFNYRMDHDGWQFLCLDSTEGRSVYRTRISKETLTWLDRTMPTLSRRRPLVILTHFPMGRNWLRPVNTKEVLRRFNGYSLQAALSGHWHGITERDEGGIHLSTGRCCSWWRSNHDGSSLKGYVLARVRDGRVSHEFVPVT